MSSTSALLALPNLEVVRSTWCDQAMTDKICCLLQEKRPDLVQSLAAEMIHSGLHGMYYRRINNLLHHVTTELSKEVGIPETRLGKLDLMFEISRRIAEVNLLTDVYLRGNPLSEGPGQPLPPLASFNPLELGAGITPQLEESVSRMTYERRPDIIYELSEQQRRMIRLQEIEGQFFSFVRTELAKQLGIADGLGPVGVLLRALSRRIQQMIDSPNR